MMRSALAWAYLVVGGMLGLVGSYWFADPIVKLAMTPAGYVARLPGLLAGGSVPAWAGLVVGVGIGAAVGWVRARR